MAIANRNSSVLLPHDNLSNDCENSSLAAPTEDQHSYIVEDDEKHTGIVYWVIAPGTNGVYTQPEEKIHYLVSRDLVVIDELIYPSAIPGKD